MTKQNRDARSRGQRQMSKWNHSICDPCWIERSLQREAVRLREPRVEQCCFCGKKHKSGIYVREDPQLCVFKGEHQG
jgi:hypothetical protein